MSTQFQLPAFAKINWTLRVLGRRADGYHELRTVFQTVTLHDTLRFTVSSGEDIHLACDSHGIPFDERNLVVRAGLALREHFKVKQGALIELCKKIPAEGGLGGGSADAAVALVGLACLWRIETTALELARIGARLGADVPFFLTGGTALGTGLGTDLTPLQDVTAEHLLIVTPNAKVSTAEAYKALNAPALTKVDGDTILSISRADAEFSDSLHEALHNDFEPAIFRAQPEIQRAKKALLESGARGALLCGSGSSVFGIFDNRDTLERARAALKVEEGWRVFPCAALSREQYWRSLSPCADSLRSRA